MSDQHDGNKLEQSLKKAGSQWRDDDLDEILALLEKDYTHPEQRRSLEKVQSLLQEDSPVEMFGCGAILSEEDVPEEPELEETAEAEQPVAPAPLGTTVPEQADFTDAPVKKPKTGAMIALSLVAAAEAVALVAVVLWWLQWLK